VDDRAFDGFYYRAVSALGAWAVENFSVIDARCLVAGVDPLDLTPDRFFNLIYTTVMEQPGLVFDGKKHEEVRELLAWPESGDDERALERSDARVRANAGFDVDRAFAAMMEARRREGLTTPEPGGEDQ
jgi:hypothetical protein